MEHLIANTETKFSRLAAMNDPTSTPMQIAISVSPLSVLPEYNAITASIKIWNMTASSGTMWRWGSLHRKKDRWVVSRTAKRKMLIWEHCPHRSALTLWKVIRKKATKVKPVAPIAESWGTWLGIERVKIILYQWESINWPQYWINCTKIVWT